MTDQISNPIYKAFEQSANLQIVDPEENDRSIRRRLDILIHEMLGHEVFFELKENQPIDLKYVKAMYNTHWKVGSPEHDCIMIVPYYCSDINVTRRLFDNLFNLEIIITPAGVRSDKYPGHQLWLVSGKIGSQFIYRADEPRPLEEGMVRLWVSYKGYDLKGL